jgi:microcystin-dependent protein
MMPYSVPSAPTGWLLANGQAVSRTTYANLFTAIGTTFGSGDGSTTFNLPDMRGRTAAGSDTMGTSAAGRLGSGPTGGFTGSAVNIGTVGGEQGHSLAADENAAHAHGVNDPWHSHGVGDPGHTHFAQNQVYVGGNFNGGPNPVNTGGSNVNGAFTGISIAANPTGISIQNSGSGNAHNTVQPTMISYWLIKF